MPAHLRTGGGRVGRRAERPDLQLVQKLRIHIAGTTPSLGDFRLSAVSVSVGLSAVSCQLGCSWSEDSVSSSSSQSELHGVTWDKSASQLLGLSPVTKGSVEQGQERVTNTGERQSDSVTVA